MKFCHLLLSGIFCLTLSAHSIADLNTGQLAYFPFDGNADDQSENGNHAAVIGATLTTDRFNNADSAYFFNGVDNYIFAPVNINPSISPIITMTAWVLADDFDSLVPPSLVGQIISHDNGGFDRSLDIDIRADNGTGWSMFAGSAGVLGGVPVVENEWAFLAASFNETSGIVKLYVNSTQVLAVTANTTAGEDFIRIGSNPGFGEFFFGKIDDVRIYNRELSLAEIEALYTGETIIADSITEFSGIQGQDNWFYGYYVTPFEASSFNLMEEFSTQWRVQIETFVWTALLDIGGHPNALNTNNIEHWAVRRYISEVTGTVKIAGTYKKANTGGGDGTTGHIIIDGVTVFSHDVDAQDGIGINYEIEVEVTEGSVVDFVITPRTSTNDGADGTFFSAVISLIEETEETDEDIASCTEPGTVSAGLDVFMPSLNYQSLLGIENIWAELKYTGLNAQGKHSWEIKDFGLNPQ